MKLVARKSCGNSATRKSTYGLLSKYWDKEKSKKRPTITWLLVPTAFAESIKKLGRNELRVYTGLLTRANWTTGSGDVRASFPKIAEAAKVSPRRVGESLTALAEAGAIVIMEQPRLVPPRAGRYWIVADDRSPLPDHPTKAANNHPTKAANTSGGVLAGFVNESAGNVGGYSRVLSDVFAGNVGSIQSLYQSSLSENLSQPHASREVDCAALGNGRAEPAEGKTPAAKATAPATPKADERVERFTRINALHRQLLGMTDADLADRRQAYAATLEADPRTRFELLAASKPRASTVLIPIASWMATQ
jgi:hypothetical protein